MKKLLKAFTISFVFLIIPSPFPKVIFSCDLLLSVSSDIRCHVALTQTTNGIILFREIFFDSFVNLRYCFFIPAKSYYFADSCYLKKCTSFKYLLKALISSVTHRFFSYENFQKCELCLNM